MRNSRKCSAIFSMHNHFDKIAPINFSTQIWSDYIEIILQSQIICFSIKLKTMIQPGIIRNIFSTQLSHLTHNNIGLFTDNYLIKSGTGRRR